jgi:hypothetical protein
MQRRSSKSLDVNSLAARIVAASTDDEEPSSKRAAHKKNPHAVALGRKGGKVGGKARAKALTAEQRREIARRAAEARWRKR